MSETLSHSTIDHDFDLGELDPDDFADFDAPIDDLVDQDAFESFFLDPESTAVARKAERMPPIDEDKYDAWLASLPEDRRQYLEDTRAKYSAERERRSAIHDKLTSLVPELYEAQLPPELDRKLEGREYALGFNQSLTNQDVTGATAYLKEHQGVDFTGYRLGHRFLMYDQSMTEGLLGKDNPKGIARAIESGYFDDVNIGRLIAVFPVENGTEITQGRLATEVNLHPDQVLPRDSRVPTSHGVSYAGKYIAGFIDKNGDFWVNKAFTVSNEPDFVPYERSESTEASGTSDFV